MWYTISFFILFISCGSLSAQIFVSGKILNSETNLPLPDANIIIIENGVGTSSAIDGTFKISTDLEEFSIQVTYIGFNPLKIRLNEKQFGSPLILRLKPTIIGSQTVLVSAAINENNDKPASYATIGKEELRTLYQHQDIPELLSLMPSVTFYSEGGSGIGYNYISIRGFDQRRISVAINGIPQNDPEDHNIYWLDMPDLLGSTGLVQVQRGSGSGAIGFPSVGGSINIITNPHSSKPSMKYFTGLGSYNFRNYGLELSSGLLNNKYSFYTRISKVMSSGYRENNWIKYTPYFISAMRYDKYITTQLNIYGGLIEDGLTYTGLPKFAIKDQALRRNNFSYWESNDENYTYTAKRRPEEKENFSQPHFELLNEIKINDNLTINSSLFLILGNGYFDYDGSWANYSYFRLSNDYGFDIQGDPDTLYLQNTLIRAQVENKQWGWIPRIKYIFSETELILGAEFRDHSSKHWGRIEYAGGIPAEVPQNHQYYYYEGGKKIANLFAHSRINLSERIRLLAEIQIAYHEYSIRNEKYLTNNFSIDGLYMNPRMGINYSFTDNISGYLSFARVTREPRLKNYYDAAESSYPGVIPQFSKRNDGSYNFSDPMVLPESMNSFELGINSQSTNIDFGINTYLMLFENEIVTNGQLDRFGQPVTGNMPKTIHYGLEGSLRLIPLNGLEILLNGAISEDYIYNGGNFITYYDVTSYSYRTIYIDLKNNRLAGFPEFSLSSVITYKNENLAASLVNRTVGQFYSDNYAYGLSDLNRQYPGLADYSDNIVETFSYFDLLLNYRFNNLPFSEQLSIKLKVSNIFNSLHAAYAIGKEFFPGPERNFILSLEAGL
ncbi:MAG: TonB-dependent receptor [Ignavibacteriales bacterium]|nr:TonB-dependent receptor [Ignavibacteriales bacterium]